MKIYRTTDVTLVSLVEKLKCEMGALEKKWINSKTLELIFSTSYINVIWTFLVCKGVPNIFIRYDSASSKIT